MHTQTMCRQHLLLSVHTQTFLKHLGFPSKHSFASVLFHSSEIISSTFQWLRSREAVCRQNFKESESKRACWRTHENKIMQHTECAALSRDVLSVQGRNRELEKINDPLWFVRSGWYCITPFSLGARQLVYMHRGAIKGGLMQKLPFCHFMWSFLQEFIVVRATRCQQLGKS